MKKTAISLEQMIMIGTLLYWLIFWFLFFFSSSPIPHGIRYEAKGPVFEVFARGVGDNLQAAMHSLWMSTNIWLNLPCWLATLPLTYLDRGKVFLGTNGSGWRLLLINGLSLLQWKIIAHWVSRWSVRTRATGKPITNQR